MQATLTTSTNQIRSQLFTSILIRNAHRSNKSRDLRAWPADCNAARAAANTSGLQTIHGGRFKLKMTTVQAPTHGNYEQIHVKWHDISWTEETMTVVKTERNWINSPLESTGSSAMLERLVHKNKNPLTDNSIQSNTTVRITIAQKRQRKIRKTKIQMTTSPASPTGQHVVRTGFSSYGRNHTLHLSRAKTIVPITTKFWTNDYVGQTKKIAKFCSNRFH